jgi:hypothetical protein
LGFWGWGWGWKQSVLEFLRMTLKTICAWVSEYEDECGNDLCLGFW